VVSLEEHDLFTEGVLRYLHDPEALGPLIGASTEELEHLRAAYWRRVRAGGAEVSGKVFIDKHPLNTLKLPLIARLFPAAKILFARRDPRDVVPALLYGDAERLEHLRRMPHRVARSGVARVHLRTGPREELRRRTTAAREADDGDLAARPRRGKRFGQRPHRHASGPSGC